MTANEFPSFYDPKNAGSWTHRPDAQRVQAEAETWAKRRGIKPAAADKFKIALLPIDVQKDFALPEGALFVGGRSGKGGVDDTRRLAEFVYRNLGRITTITPTMDSHLPIQIFFSTFWRDGAGNHPGAFTVVTADDIRKGKFEIDPAAAQFAVGRDGRPNLAWARNQSLFYAEQLEKSGRYALIIWPPHCLLGDAGHALMGVLQEARLFHSAARGVQSEAAIKGGNPWTENFSVFGAEVRQRWDGQGELAQKNLKLVHTLITNDAIVVGGEAASHCVRWSVDDLLSTIRELDDTLVKKVYVLEDCTSAVVTPVMDFTDETTKAFDAWRSAGVNIVKSTDDIRDWPGMDAIA